MSSSSGSTPRPGSGCCTKTGRLPVMAGYVLLLHERVAEQCPSPCRLTSRRTRLQTIHHLTFHPSYPHLLASASEDKTLRLWDPTVPWGSDERVRRTLPKGGQRGATSRREEELRTAEGGRTSRPRVEGELLGVMAEGGHEKAVMSCVSRRARLSPLCEERGVRADAPAESYRTFMPRYRSSSRPATMASSDCGSSRRASSPRRPSGPTRPSSNTPSRLLPSPTHP